jgi:FixJ family two-component response regulator
MTPTNRRKRILSNVSENGRDWRELSGASASLALGSIVDGFQLHWLAGRQMEAQMLVAVVDDDESVRESLPGLLRQMGLAAQTFASAQDFLAYDSIGETRCLLLDISMPGMSGPELHRELIRRGYSIPTIFITGRSSDSLPSDLFQHGAIECLFKPFSGEALRAAVNAALPGH